MNRTFFREVTVADPASPYNRKKVNLIVKGGSIEEIGPNLEPGTSDNVVDFGENEVFVSPGWLDMEVHLNDPGFEHKETLEELNIAAHQGGFTSILCYPDTNPSIDTASMANSLKVRKAAFPTKFLLTGSATKGNEGNELAELFDMHQQGISAFTNGINPITHQGLLLRILRYLKTFNGLFIHQSYSPTLAHSGMIHEGKTALQLGMASIPSIAETSPVLSDLEIVKYEEARVHFQPVSSPEVVEHISRAKSTLSQLSLATPVIYFCLDDQEIMKFDSSYKVEPPLRQQHEVIELRKKLTEGKIDVLSSGHRAQGLEEKDVEYALAEPGMLGLQTFYSLANEYLIQSGVISLDQFIELASINPRKILQVPGIGIEEGGTAELSFFSPGEKWKLQKEDIPSRAKNSPLLESELTGKVKGVFVSGEWLPC